MMKVDWESKYIQCNNEYVEYKQKVKDAINKYFGCMCTKSGDLEYYTGKKCQVCELKKELGL